MVSLFGRGFDSLQLHSVTPSRGLTLVRVLSVASLCESGKAERDSLQLHNFSLITQKHRFPAVILWPHREVQPVATALVAFYQQLVIVLSGLVGVVHQDHRIPYRLLDAGDADIHGTARQVIACRGGLHRGTGTLCSAK